MQIQKWQTGRHVDRSTKGDRMRAGKKYQNYHEAECLEKSITPQNQNNMHALRQSFLNHHSFHSLLDRGRRLPFWLTSEKASHSSERQRKVSVYNAELPRKASSNSHQFSTQPLSEENHHWQILQPSNGESPRERNQRLSNLELSATFDNACKIDQEQDRKRYLSLTDLSLIFH